MRVVENMNEIWEHLKGVKDPELPILDIVELGIVRKVERSEGKLQVTITPTYSGCPAMRVIEDEIVKTLKDRGYDVEVRTSYAPPWTTDWLTQETKEKLKASGIAPPCTTDDNHCTVHCPFCDSKNVTQRSQFGSTPCKALYFCNACIQPFDAFKTI